jgi:hypothetical protein
MSVCVCVCVCVCGCVHACASMHPLRCHSCSCMQHDCAHRCRADAATAKQRWQQCHVGARTRCSPATSAPGPRRLLPHLHRDCPSSCHICTGTKWAHPARSAPELHTLRSPRRHICTVTGLAAAAPAPTLDSPRCHSYADNGHAPDWHIPAPSGVTALTASPRIGLTPSTSAPGPRAPPPRRLQDCALLRFPATSAPDRLGAAASAKWEWPKWDQAV